MAKALAKGFPDNPFAKIQDGALKLKCRDALPMPAWIKKLRRLIHTRLPRVRIENLLAEVDSMCHFTQAFRPLEAHPPCAEPDNLGGTLHYPLVPERGRRGSVTGGSPFGFLSAVSRIGRLPREHVRFVIAVEVCDDK